MQDMVSDLVSVTSLDVLMPYHNGIFRYSIRDKSNSCNYGLLYTFENTSSVKETSKVKDNTSELKIPRIVPNNSDCNLGDFPVDSTWPVHSKPCAIKTF